MNFLLSMNNGVRVGMMNFTKLKARNKVFCATFLQKSSEKTLFRVKPTVFTVRRTRR